MPKVSSILVECIPLELRQLHNRWVCWQEKPSVGGNKPVKPPINALMNFSGKHHFAKVNGPETWANFDTALVYWESNLQKKKPSSGLNFALNGDGIIGIDLDDCRDPKMGKIENWAIKIIRRLNSYTEISPSGKGIRIFVRGKLPTKGRHKGKIEVYDEKKFLSVTGNRIECKGISHKIEDRSSELLKWHHEVFEGSTSTINENKIEKLKLNLKDLPEIDPKKLKHLFEKKPEAKLIFNGDHDYSSQSEAEMALANMAAANGWSGQKICNLLIVARNNVGEEIKHLGYYESTIAKALQAHKKKSAFDDPKFKERAKAAHKKYLESLNGSDEIDIPGDKNENSPAAGSMADVAKLVDGVKYLIKDWIPFGMVTMLVGEPGTGKSAFALFALAGPIIRGGDWFNGKSGPDKTGKVLWCDCESTAAITIQRIKDWGLPAEKILVPFADDPLHSLNLNSDDHLDLIEGQIRKYKIKLVVIDSLRGAHDGDENCSRVAGVVKKLNNVSERTNAAIVIIHHTKKLFTGETINANSSRGSNAIVSLVRSQLGIDKPDPKSKWVRLQMLKENLGLKPKPIGFLVTGKGVEFGDPPGSPQKETVKELAEKFLFKNIKTGKIYKASEMIEAAKMEGISEDAINRARNEIGIKAKKTKNGWEWELVTNQERK